tara:strand:- start:64 stop:306 length:243 start_codon:yes stop_codon:yes gene_type:complete
MTNRLTKNTRVKELKEMLASETDPDKIEILEFDLMEAMGRKTTKPVKRRNGSPRTGEVAKGSKSRGGGAAIAGMNFKGVF